MKIYDRCESYLSLDVWLIVDESIHKENPCYNYLESLLIKIIEYFKKDI